MPRHILILGGGFAGLWAAAGAARLLAERTIGPDAVRITLVNPDPFHVIRVRCYEADLAPTRLPLDDTLAPIGVARIEGTATAIDPAGRTVSVNGQNLAYDALVIATGSTLRRPPAEGLATCAFDVDTYAGATRLQQHIAALAQNHPVSDPGRWTAIVIGAGLVGIEIACELPARLRAAQPTPAPVQVILLDHNPIIGAAMGEPATPIIRDTLAALGIECRAGASVRRADAAGVVLHTGERIAARTILCATGMRASPLADALPVAHDPLGRLIVDPYLAVEGMPGILAAGDIACARADTAGHVTVMSCQHARPMGRIAGHNAACSVLGLPDQRIAFAAPDYVTILDLGPRGALYTRGWDRAAIIATGAEAKRVKQTINGRRIYPPPHGDREAILAAAAPIIQAAPPLQA